MVLAAGLGTRLRPLTRAVPKPLLPLGDRPLLEHALRTIDAAGLGPQVVVNTHYLAASFESWRGEASLDVQLSHETVLLGTAGGIAAARPRFAPGPVVVLTSDVVLEKVPDGFRESASHGGMVLALAPRPRGAGTVGIDGDGHVVRLRGRTFGKEHQGGEYVGLMALGDQALDALPKIGCYIQDYALPLLERGGLIETRPYPYRFVIAGDDVPSYFAENLRWVDREGTGGVFVGPGASVASSVELRQSVVGRGAFVDGHGRVERCVIFPGARCTAPLEDMIVTPELQLSPSSWSA
jgi:mannose-1-phosphate guanylyltransferase